MKDKQHKKATLMRWSKTQLVEYIQILEHNNSCLNEALENSTSGFIRIYNERLEEYKKIVEGD